MSTQSTTVDQLLAPILPDWTIRDLLDWLSDDARAHDPALRDPLMLIDAVLTGTPWSREPSTVALIRSIASTVQTSPHRRNMRLDDLLPRPRGIENASPDAELEAFSSHAAESGRTGVAQVV